MRAHNVGNDVREWKARDRRWGKRPRPFIPIAEFQPIATNTCWPQFRSGRSRSCILAGTNVDCFLVRPEETAWNWLGTGERKNVMGNSRGRDNVKKRAARRKKTERLALAKKKKTGK